MTKSIHFVAEERRGRSAPTGRETWEPVHPHNLIFDALSMKSDEMIFLILLSKL